MRDGKTLVLALLSACGGATPGAESGAMDDASTELESSARTELPDASAGSDAPMQSDATASLLDGAADATPLMDATFSSDADLPDVRKHDASAPDGGPTSCDYEIKPDYALCLAAGFITAASALTMQNTAQGGMGDCALSASGLGGRNLYYRFKAPAGIDTKVVVTSKRLHEPAVVRILADCYAERGEASARGLSDGFASTCIDNQYDEAREVIIAVGRYSGDFTELTVDFDLQLTSQPPGRNCGW